MDTVKDLFKDWGLPTATLPALAWLWSAGLMHWLLLVIAVFLGFWVYVLQKPLPIFPKQSENLKSIAEGKNLSAQTLKRRVERLAKSMQVAQVSFAAANSGRWQQSLIKTEAFFSQHLGAALLTYKGFNTLLLVALVYPLLILLGTWVITGEGRLGNAQVLPDFGSGFKRLAWALFLVFLAALPWLAQATAKLFKPHWYQAYAGQGFLFWHQLRQLLVLFWG